MEAKSAPTAGGNPRVLVASFDTLGGANLAAKTLQGMEQEGLLDVDNTVTAIKNATGQVDIKDFSDVSVGDGAKLGALVGGAIGLLFPPSILASAALGGLVGGITAKLRASGFDAAAVQEMAESLEPGASMLVTVVAPQWTEQAEAALAGAAHRIAWVEMEPAAPGEAGQGALN
jgi:uncharacterized membrane protein